MNVHPENHYEVGESDINPALVGLNVQYRVRPITRYVVTRYESEITASGMGKGSAGCSNHMGAEYDNYDVAFQVAYALAKAEHERLGYAPGDMRIQYPQATTEQLHKDA